ncbi:septum site-determining protein MinC [Hydrogenophaga sp.]|uniref:septum site-determining protein MinC n=1 Tax=Hydrogenophaga sp. TaxID=1904254 RepID=UPI00286E4687|nr:septum site-determining protein MinC [Hydrogenophaga sp.]
MSVALAANAPATFEIKSAQLPLVALLLKSADLAQLAAEFAQRFGDMPDFFDHDPLVIDLTPLQAGGQADSPVDFVALGALLRQYRLQPLAVRGGNEAQTAAALLAGLIQANDATVQRGSSAPAPAPATAAAAPVVETQATPVAPTPAPGALVVDKPLRSGQQVYARGRDLVVMAMVNPGAEVIADGHIHVYAPLRGKAIAGARGNADARIFALGMDPELISIAGIYRTSDTPLPASVQGKAAQVRLVPGPDGEKLVIEPLNP